MWPEIVEYLKDASLVAEIQKAFGVRIHYRTNLKEYHEENSTKETREITSPKVEHDVNNCTRNSEESRENGAVPIAKKCINATNTCASYDEQKQSFPTANYANYTISNYFWYYLFLFGTQLGDELFYSTFIPFWFWNIDGAVGRRVVLVWTLIMTTGQILKDVICWPRPACPPAVRLQTKWSEEYGMPSTHAMIGVSIPFSVLLFTMNRYIYPVSIGWTIAFLWCTLVCMSRLYLGMHTVLDILAGLILAIALMILLIPLVDVTDYYIISNIWALAALITFSIIVIVYYPTSRKWTPTRGDTSMVISVTMGVHFGAWLNYKTGVMITPSKPPPYHILWPTNAMLGYLILRTILGFCSILATRVVCKSLSYRTMCAILKINSKDLMRSLNTVYLLPNIFTMIGIERPTFYTEI
ncbi:Sphingosine-1-phosphate phosphatase 1 [Dufourea novaeangliae]|uniref:Sphingosine-1-phosphate phosphatase 1 n=1 Tax=Dufourea novaeangliae TaxID=178035 RepID=A0A154PD58_DUFNO|nr:Sphingosine-1-phosphate phosphatase 1 [Dufourea novaeangliae]